MGVVEPAMFLLVKLCFISFALAVSRSTGFNISSSPITSTEITPIPGTPGPVDDKSFGSNAPGPVSQPIVTGPVSHPTLALPPLLSTPAPQTINAFVPSLPPNSSTTLPPYYATPPPTTFQDHVPSIPPVVNTSVPITPSRSPIVPSLTPINSTPSPPLYAVPSLPSNSSTALPPYYATPPPTTSQDHVPSIPSVVNTSVPITPSRSPMVPSLTPINSTPSPPLYAVPSLPSNSSTALPPYYATPPPSTSPDHVPSIPPVVNTSVPITPSRSPMVPSLSPINSTPSPPLYAVPSLPSNSSTALPPYYATPPPSTSQDHVPSIPPVVNTSVPITPSRSPMVPSLSPINSTPLRPHNAVSPSTNADHLPSITPTAPQEKEPIVKAPISMPIAPVPAAPPLRNTPQVATAIPPSTQKISPSSSYHENSTHERVAPAEPITPVYVAPSPSVSVQNPPLVSNNHQHISPSVLPVAPPTSEMPKNSSIGPAIPGIPPSMLPDHDVSPMSLPPVGMFRKNDGVPVAAPSFEIPKPTTSVAHSPTNADARHSNRAPPSPALSPKSPPMQEYHPSASSPLSSFYKHHHARNKTASPAPSLTFPTSSPAPKQLGPIIPEPSRSSRRRHYAPPPLNHVSPSKSPSKIPRVPLVPPLALPPPPPNEDCSSTICTEPYTNTPPGSPCGCVMPIQVGLRLTVDLYTFFPLVSELAWETAASVFIKQSQVRIIGANEANQQPDKTVVLVDLVPLGDKFDNTTAFFIFERFWNKQVAIKPSFFGDYEVLYVRYPGLPSSPPASDLSLPDSGPYSGVDSNLRPKKPLGVNVHKRRHKKRFSGGVIAIIALSSFAAVILCSAAAWFLLFKHRNKLCQPASTPRDLLSSIATKQSGTNYAGSLMESRHSSACLSFGSSIPPYKGSAKTFSSNDIERATGHFDASKILGEGGFGLVYSGVLEDGTKIAVKILKRDDQQGGREFLAEVEMLSRLHHRNLVKLIGICTEEHTRCLVYELISNGSVESHLHGVHKQLAPLDWGARMKIALGAARGLAYLHEDSSPRVIHRDFKSSNILLEDDFTPKVSDFGLARTALDEENRHISTRVMGTFGYVAPEYAMTGHLLVKSDVYSYGVVLLELLIGRKPVDMSQPPGQENLVTWARPFLSSKEGLERIIDPSLGPDVPFERVAKVAAIASMCVQPEVSHRPFMGEVVQALKLICSEHEEASEVGSRRSSQEEISIDIAAGASTTSGQYPDPLQSQYSVPSYYESEPDNERGLSPSDLFNTSTRLGREHSRSFRRHSSAGPLRDTGGRRFWQRVRRLSGGSVSEHGVMLRLWPGSY